MKIYVPVMGPMFIQNNISIIFKKKKKSIDFDYIISQLSKNV